MDIELVEASIDKKPVLANLLELYTYELAEVFDCEIGEDGLYGYPYLPLYWTESTRFPYLIYVNNKLAGFALIQRGSPISEDTTVWDMSEFFIMNKYKRLGIGAAAAGKIWEKFKGPWQIRALVKNKNACLFWADAIKKFTTTDPANTQPTIKAKDWLIYTFQSN